MSKKRQIRWRESDYREVERLVKNFNAKISYQLKKNPEAAAYLPEKIKKADIVAAVETRGDFTRITNSLKRFSQRGAEQEVKSSRGATATKWAVDEFKRKQKLVNKQRAKKLKEIEKEPVKIGGQSTGVTRAEMGSIKENSLKPSNKNFKNLSQKEWELASKSIDNALNAAARNERAEQMRENYIKGLKDAGFLGANPDLEKVIRSVDADTFVKTATTDDTASFMFYKDPAAWDVRLGYITASWEAAATQN